MSLIKRAVFPGVHDGELLVHEVQPGSLVKTASAVSPGTQEFIGCLKPDPRYTYVLVNAMGYSQFYGANSNKDWYGYNSHLDFDGLLHSWPDIGKNVEADRMKGKGWPYGYPCFYGATAYAHHKNTDPQRLGFGDVIFAAPNERMKRIELVERIFNEEACKKGHTSILSRIRAGSRVDVSMGCKVPFDLCSICTDWDEVKRAWRTFDSMKHRHPGVAVLHYHKKVNPIRGLAITRKDYCPHMLTMGGKILPDGRKVFVYNDFPRFFDISFVWIGADRTARVMWHLAEGDLPEVTSPSSSGVSMLERFIRRAMAGYGGMKMAAMEKEIPDGVAQAVHADAASMPPLSKTQIRVVTNDPKAALSTLASLGIVLSPSEFQRMVIGDKLFGQDLTKVSFDTGLSEVDDTYAVDPEAFSPKYAEAFSPVMPSRSAFAPFLNERLLSPAKVAAEPEEPKPVLKDPLMGQVGAMYNGYRLSVLEKAPELMPKALPYVPKAPPFGGDPASLLLGAGPMIHLLSSHLPQEKSVGPSIGTMSSIASQPHSFVALATIGVAIREALKWANSKGLLDAAKTVVQIARKIL